MVEEVKATEVVRLCKPPRVSPTEAASGRYPCVTFGHERAKFWLMAEDIGEGCLGIAFMSRFPQPFPPDAKENPRRIPMHNIELELEAITTEELLGLEPGYGKNRDETAIVTFLLQEGLCPHQPFQVDMTVRYEGHTSLEWIGTEWETVYDWDVIGSEHMEPEEHAERWEEWLKTFRVGGLVSLSTGLEKIGDTQRLSGNVVEAGKADS